MRTNKINHKNHNCYFFNLDSRESRRRRKLNELKIRESDKSFVGENRGMATFITGEGRGERIIHCR